MNPQKPTILVVDDEAPLREALETTLRAEKFNVVLAENGKEALEKINKQVPDLIILDIAMPQMNGVEVMKKLKEQDTTKDLPIIFLTNLSDVETIANVVKGGVFDYLVKTEWDIDELVSLVKKRLAKA